MERDMERDMVLGLERDHEASDTTLRREARILGSVAALAVLLGAALAAMPGGGSNVLLPRLGYVDLSIPYSDGIWSAEGPPEALSAASMQPIGRARTGDVLYAHGASRPGGGGGGPMAAATERIYLKTLDGRFQPFVRSTFLHEQVRQQLQISPPEPPR